jgi:hypothetical protein
MNKNRLNISKIETYLNSIIDNVVSENTFFTTVPDASVVKSSDWTDMVLVNLPVGIRDLEAYGRGEVDIVLYARPLESGKKNVAKMSQLEERLNEVIANTRSKDYQLVREDARSMYDADIDWHCNVITYILLVS